MVGPASIWDNPATVEALRRLWADGDSCSRIGAALGASRNSIIGKARRLGLEPRRQTPASFVRKPRARPQREPESFLVARIAKAQRQKANRNDPRIAFDATLPPEPEVIEAPPEFLGISLLDLEDGQCRYPRGDGADILFCGQPVVNGESWCAGCRAIVYAPPPARRDNSPAPARHGYRLPVTQLKAFGG